MDYAKEFMRTFEGACRRYDRHRVFLDWITLASSSLLAHSSPFHREEAEAAYLQTSKAYQREEMEIFAKLFGITTAALEQKFQDFLGHVFMNLELGNKHQGQFFTPYAVSLLCAQMTVQRVDTSKRLLTFSEPACGSGGMIIACMEVLRDQGINFQNSTYTEAVDVSEMAARMAYVQFSLLGIPAKVVLGNSLTLETRAVWPTLFYGRVCHLVSRWRAGTLDNETQPVEVPEPTESRFVA